MCTYETFSLHSDAKASELHENLKEMYLVQDILLAQITNKIKKKDA